MTASQSPLPVTSFGSGPDLVLLHGWGLHSEFFLPWLPALTPYCRVHLLDLSGHGLSIDCRPYELPQIAAEIARSMQAIAARYAVCGWSLGGAVAQRLAIDYPNVITHIITLASTPRFTRSDDWPHATTEAALNQLGQALHKNYLGTLAQFFELNLASKYRPLANTLRQLGAARPAPTITALREGLLLMSELDLRTEVAQIKAPLLAISGRLDRLSYSQSSAWLAQICGGTHIDLPHSAHIPHLSDGNFCAAAILRHLDRSIETTA